MEMAGYIRLFRKWLWLILVFAIISGGVSFIVSTGRPPVYSASTTVAIGRFIDSPNPNTGDIQTGISLAQTYAQLMHTPDVLQGTIDALNLNMTQQRLDQLFSTQILTGTSLLVITVNYTDPVLTADMANTLAEQLISRSPTNLTTSQQAQIDYANTQIEALDRELRQQRESLDVINAQLASAQNAQEIARLTDLKSSTVEQINQASATIAQFQTTISSIEQRTNSLDIVARAGIPPSPIASNILGNTLSGATVGAMLAIGLVFLLDYLDDTIRTTETAAQVLELPVLGAIPQIGKKNAPYPERLVAKEEAMSPVAESYRRLQTNLMTLSMDSHKHVFLITSSGPGDGKSVTAANLATTMAKDGLRVLLIDADLRRPKQHEIFGLENEVGLTTLLIANVDTKGKPESEAEKQSLSKLEQCIQLTAIPKLKIITSGFVPSNPTEVLRSALMKRWLDAFRAASDIDVIIIDTPPALLFGDSTIIATVADADVVVVIDSQSTRRRVAVKMKEQFTQLDIDIKGVIVNRINLRDEADSYGYGYGYGYSYYYSADESRNEEKSRRRLWPWPPYRKHGK